MSTDQPRTPAGSPTGGQFAGVGRPESDVELPGERAVIHGADHDIVEAGDDTFLVRERDGREAGLLSISRGEADGCPTVTIGSWDAEGEWLGEGHGVRLENRYLDSLRASGVVPRPTTNGDPSLTAAGLAVHTDGHGGYTFRDITSGLNAGLMTIERDGVTGDLVARVGSWDEDGDWLGDGPGTVLHNHYQDALTGQPADTGDVAGPS